MARKLVVLDDDDVACEIVCASAAKAGFSAVSYGSVATFQRSNDIEDCDLLVLDLNLLDTDGVEVLKYLATLRFPAPILLVSSLEERVLYSTLRVGTSLGLQLLDPVRKPIRPSELATLLASVSMTHTPLRQVDLENAIEGKQIYVAYQPQVSLHDGRMTGVEALARWQHPERGAILPVEFIDLAENGPNIDELTYYIARQAFRDCRTWSENGRRLSVAVNLSARSLSNPNFSDRLEQIVHESGLQTDQITLEITETSAMSEASAMLAMLTQLRIRGFHLSMDDFGTGYSSLRQMHRLPFSEVKIDRTFIVDMDSDQEARTIAGAMIGLSHKLGMKVVAEGIEDKAVMKMLRDEGCDIGQGFYLGKPMLFDDMVTWLQEAEAAFA